MARDPHLRARSSDRNAAISAIQAAYAQGLIGDADRTLRVANAEQATTVGELDLLTRDLVPDAPADPSPTTSPSSTPPVPQPTPQPAAGQSWPTYTPPTQPPTTLSRPYAGGAPRKPPGSAKAGGIVVAAILVVVGASGLIANLGAGPDDYSVEFGEGLEPGDPQFGDPDFGDPEPEDVYSLDAPGVDAFIGLLEAELGTSSVLRAVFYPDYVVLDVPTGDGKARHTSWLYREGTLRQTGDARANTARDQPVDLRDVALDGLQISLDTARTELGVEDPETTYAIVSHTWAEDVPTVSVHVTNQFSESGYLATDLSGTELRRHPFRAP